MRWRTARAWHVAGIMQHIEEAGIHSGRLGLLAAAAIRWTRRLMDEMQAARPLRWRARWMCVGLMNVQYAVQAGTVYLTRGEPPRLAAPCRSWPRP